jgi:hypothetical protein
MLIWGIIFLVAALISLLVFFYLMGKESELAGLPAFCVVIAGSLAISFLVRDCGNKSSQFNMQGCIQSCNTIPLETGGFECFTCCGKQYINEPMIDMCKQAVWPFLNDAAKEKILEKENTSSCKILFTTTDPIARSCDSILVSIQCLGKDLNSEKEIAFSMADKVCKTIHRELDRTNYLDTSESQYMLICKKSKPEKECNCEKD